MPSISGRSRSPLDQENAPPRPPRVRARARGAPRAARAYPEAWVSFRNNTHTLTQILFAQGSRNRPKWRRPSEYYNGPRSACEVCSLLFSRVVQKIVPDPSIGLSPARGRSGTRLTLELSLAPLPRHLCRIKSKEAKMRAAMSGGKSKRKASSTLAQPLLPSWPLDSPSPNPVPAARSALPRRPARARRSGARARSARSSRTRCSSTRSSTTA